MKSLKKTLKASKTSLVLSKHRSHILSVLNPEATPYRLGSNRDRAWRVVSLMDGLTVEKAHDILEALEPNIQGKVKRPLGWVADAINYGVVNLKEPVVK